MAPQTDRKCLRASITTRSLACKPEENSVESTFKPVQQFWGTIYRRSRSDAIVVQDKLLSFPQVWCPSSEPAEKIGCHRYGSGCL